MARNFAQIAFLIYAFVLLALTRKYSVQLLERKMGKAAFHRRVRGGSNAFLFLTVKDAMAKGLFYFNLINYSALGALFLLHLLLGWFSPIAIFFRIFNALIVLSCALEAFLLTLVGNQMQFGKMFFLYLPDPDPAHDRSFASSVIDLICYVAIPLALAICNFTL